MITESKLTEAQDEISSGADYSHREGTTTLVAKTAMRELTLQPVSLLRFVCSGQDQRVEVSIQPSQRMISSASQFSETCEKPKYSRLRQALSIDQRAGGACRLNVRAKGKNQGGNDEFTPSHA